jgi:hypothetical protein
MPNLASPKQTKCYYCDNDAMFYSDIDGYTIEVCRAHFKYMYVG